MISDQLSTKIAKENMRKLKKWAFLILLAILLVPTQITRATSESPWSIYIECEINQTLFSEARVCMDEQCNLKIVNNGDRSSDIFLDGELAGDLYEDSANFLSNYIFLVNRYAYNLPDILTIDQLCQADLMVENEKIEQLYWNWNYSQDNTFRIARYTPRLEKQLIEVQNELLNCNDVDYVSSKDFIAYNYPLKSYCKESIFPVYPISNQGKTLSPLNFFLYLSYIRDPVGDQYLAVALVMAVIFIAGHIFLYRRAELKEFFRFSRFHLWGVLIALPIICLINIFLFPYFIYMTIGYYYLLSLIHYIWKRTRPKAQAT